MRYATLCSGIETPYVAWHDLGWQPVWFSEIEPFPKALLSHHYPNVPDLGDMTKIHNSKTYQNEPVDLICAGTPCQSFSLAGLRRGLDDPRGNLTLHFLRILTERRPRWVVWENVPDIVSSWSDAETDNEGRIWQTNDFDTFLAGLCEIGYSVAWRVLDAQYFGLAQRRERLFVVGYFGADWRPPYAVLSDPSCLSGNPAPRRSEGPGAAALTANSVGTCGPSGDECQNLVVGTLTACMNDKWGSNQWVDQNLFAIQPIFKIRGGKEGGGKGYLASNKSFAITTDQKSQYLNTSTGVRRLTPKECERLQGFPDDYTRIPYRGKAPEQCPDGPRYRAIGNAMPVPVIRWIGQKIEHVNKSLQL